jgi:thymidylate synthase (FAD)
MGDDLFVVNAARVSFHKISEQFSDRDEKLISYLAKHRHWTPFAHPQITLRIKAPISIRTQLFKHKVGFVENEVSRRYVDETPEVYIPKWRTAPVDGAKQGSGGFVDEADSRRAASDFLYRDSVEKCMDVYESMILQGIAPEQARFVLPQGTYTEWWWTGSLAAYARVYAQRSDSHAQWEVREYADAIGEVISPLFPVSWKALALP